MKITIVGSGYVGLVSGACFASFGHDVVCVDVDRERVERLCRGEIPIYEPGLDALVADGMEAGRLRFTTRLADAVTGCEVVFLAVGTPSRRGDGHADLSYVYRAARDVARCATGPLVLVTKSTVPVGTGDEIERIVDQERSDIVVASNPEFLREGSAIEDFKRPDRIVVGADDARGHAALEAVYRPLALNAAPIYRTARRTAELIKYAGNAYLAMRITFINEMADLCEALDADVQAVARGIGLDNRIGPKFLHAGPGYGGSCFPKDTLALTKTAQDAGRPLRLIETTVAVNDQRKRAMARKVAHACGGSVRGRRIAVLGLTFKPNTDDMREAPSLALIQALEDGGASIVATDPEGIAEARRLLPDLETVPDAYEAAQGADAVVLVTEWDGYRALDLGRLAKAMRGRVAVDLRNAWAPEAVLAAGLDHHGVGRAPQRLPARKVEGAKRAVPSGAAPDGVAAQRLP